MPPILSSPDTTRAPRPGEQDGVHYHYCSREQLQKLIDEDGFVEHAEYSGNHYGTSKQAVKDVLEKGKVCVSVARVLVVSTGVCVWASLAHRSL